MVLTQNRVRRIRGVRIVEHFKLVLLVDDGTRAEVQGVHSLLHDGLGVRLDQRENKHVELVRNLLHQRAEARNTLDRLLNALDNAIAQLKDLPHVLVQFLG